MEHLPELQRIFVEKEHLAPVIMKLHQEAGNADDGGSAFPKMHLVTNIVEMCQDIFENRESDYNEPSTTLMPTSGGEEGRVRRISLNSASLEAHPTDATPQANVVPNIVEKCIQKFRQIMRYQYDMKSVTLDRYMRQSDLNTARETAYHEAFQILIRSRDAERLPSEQVDLLEAQIKRQIAQEYNWVEKVNNHKRQRFIHRMLNEVTRAFTEKLETKYGFLLQSSEKGGKLQFCDSSRLEQHTREWITETLAKFRSYFQFTCDPSQKDENPDHLASEHLEKLQKEVLSQNQKAMDIAKRFLHSHVEDSVADCAVGVQKALDGDPLATKEHLYSAVINHKVNKYKEEFLLRVGMTEENAEFHNDFDRTLASRIEKEVTVEIENCRQHQQKAMTQFSEEVLLELPLFISRLSKQHKIHGKVAMQLSTELVEVTKRTLNIIRRNTGMKINRWTCVPIPSFSAVAVQGQGTTPSLINVAGAFSIQLGFKGIHVGFHKNGIPHMLQCYNSGIQSFSAEIPLQVGLTTTSPPELVCGPELEDRKSQGTLKACWDLAKMFHEKQHSLSLPEPVSFRDVEFYPILEFLLGWLFKHVKKHCLEHVRSHDNNSPPSMSKCLISVPPRLLPFQRQQVKDAALIAGFQTANVRIVNETSCLVYPMTDKDNLCSKDDGNYPEEILVISQYTDYLDQAKIDFIQYKRQSVAKLAVEHYVDEELILQRHVSQCKICGPAVPSSVSQPLLTPLCECAKGIAEPSATASAVESFISALLKEALGSSNNSKVTRVLFKCQFPEWKTIFESKLGHYLPNMSVEEGVKQMSEHSILQGLISMSSHTKGLWHCWIQDLSTRARSVMARSRGGALRKLQEFKVNEKPDPKALFKIQLAWDEKEVNFNFGTSDFGSVTWGNILISRSIPENQVVRVSAAFTPEGTFKVGSVDVCWVKPDKQTEFFSSLEIGKDYQLSTGSLSEAQMTQYAETLRGLSSHGSPPRTLAESSQLGKAPNTKNSKSVKRRTTPQPVAGTNSNATKTAPDDPVEKKLRVEENGKP